MKIPLTEILLGCIMLLGPLSSHASMHTDTILDIGTFNSQTTENTGQTYSGTGFVGLESPNLFAHHFAYGSSSRTILEVDISEYANCAVNSAHLEFWINDGSGSPAQMTVTSFSANGNLGGFWEAPDNLGHSTYTVDSQSLNSLDVTALLRSRLAANGTWFGLHLASEGPFYGYTDTYQNGSIYPDSAWVKLTVDYSPVPEPSTYLAGLCCLGILGSCAWHKRK